MTQVKKKKKKKKKKKMRETGQWGTDLAESIRGLLEYLGLQI
jgi:hypothetical protein